MAKFTGPTIIEAQDVYKMSSVPSHKVGQLAWDEDGNRYRYVKAGAVALIPGQLVQEAAEDTNYRSMVCAANSAIGAKTVSVTLGGTAVTAGQFDRGYLWIESGTGLGQQFKIVKHTVQTSTTGTCVFTLDRPLETAIVATTTQVTVRKNPYSAVITSPVTTATGGQLGVAVSKLTALYYGWIQSGGLVAALFDTGTNTSNGVTGIGPSLAVAGSVKPQTGVEGGVVIGYSMEVVSVDSTHGLIHLQID